MPYIRSVEYFRNNFDEISRIVGEISEPVLRTKNGYDYMVLMSIDGMKRNYLKMKFI